MDRQEPITLRLMPTPDKGWAIVLYVATTVMVVADDPVLGTAYADWVLPGKLSVKPALQSHIYAGKVDAPDGYCGFMFLDAKTPEQMRIAYLDYQPARQPPQWPAVLRRVRTAQDDTLPLSAALSDETIANAARYYVTVDMVPPTEGGSLRVRKYFSTTKPSVTKPDGPVPSTVNWDLPHASDLYSCLHDDIYVPAVGSGGMLLTGADARTMAYASDGEFFPATKMRTWEEYTVSDGLTPWPSEENQMAWVREWVTAEPPDMPLVSRDRI